jgi:hypothetical protein
MRLLLAYPAITRKGLALTHASKGIGRTWTQGDHEGGHAPRCFQSRSDRLLCATACTLVADYSRTAIRIAIRIAITISTTSAACGGPSSTTERDQ